jgi:hypothetical protein
MIDPAHGNSAIVEHHSQRMGQPDGARRIAVQTKRIDVEMEQ